MDRDRTRFSLRFLLIGLAVMSAVAMSGVSVVPAANAMRTLDRLAIRGLDRLRPVGRANPDSIMRVAVSLQRPDTAGEDRALAAMYDPESPMYHEFFTAESFAARFGVAAADRLAVRRWLEGGSLDVLYTSTPGDYFIASGKTKDVERLFGVHLNRYRYRGTSFVANDRAPRVPATLPINGVIGLDSRAQHVPVSMGEHHPKATNTGQLSPQELWSVYEMPDATIGAGVEVGIIGAGDTNEPISSLRSFEATYKLRKVPVRVVRTPANGSYTFSGVAGEWNLDVAAVGGMAQGIKSEVLYTSPSFADTDLMGSLSHWAGDGSAPLIMSMSYGECEQGPANSELQTVAPLDGNEHPSPNLPQLGLANSSHPAEDQILKQAVMEGRTLFAAAGDAGAGCSAVYGGALNTNGVLPQIDGLTEDPGSSPFAVSVGGTVLYTDGQTPAHRVLEYAWTYSGGNASPFITAPGYQHNVPNLIRPCIVDHTGSPSNTGQLCRGAPDVAALSGDLTGNGYAGSGGTSLSTPLWAGMWARIVGASPAGRKIGFANEAIYALAKDPAKYSTMFYDITVGDNGNPALTGWDYVTGWGAPRVGGLIKELLGLVPKLPKIPIPRVASGIPTCVPAFVDAKGDQANTLVLSSDITPSTDIINGYLRYSASTGDVTYYITVDDLTEQVPGTNTTMSWNGYYTTPDGTIHFVRAILDFTGAKAFEYGTFVPNPTGAVLVGVSEYQGTTTGRLVDGKNGTIQIVLPSGVAPKGAKLTGLYATSGEGHTLPVAAPGYFRGVSQILDTAPDTGSGDWTVAPCGVSSAAHVRAVHPKPIKVEAKHVRRSGELPATGVARGLDGLVFLGLAAAMTAWIRRLRTR